MIVSQLDLRGNIVDRLTFRGIHYSIHSFILERGVEGFSLRTQHTPVGPADGRISWVFRWSRSF